MLHALGSLRMWILVISCVSMCGFVEGQTKRRPFIDEILDEIVPVELDGTTLSMGRVANYAARIIDKNGNEFFWFSLAVFLQKDRKPLIQGTCAYQAEPLRDRVSALYTANPDLTAEEIAERLLVRRFSVSSEGCPGLVPLIKEIEKGTLSLDLPSGVTLDTDSYEFAIQTNSAGVCFHYDGLSGVDSSLLRWFESTRDLLRGPCQGKLVDGP